MAPKVTAWTLDSSSFVQRKLRGGAKEKRIILSSNPDDTINPSINRVAYLGTLKLFGLQAGLVFRQCRITLIHGVTALLVHASILWFKGASIDKEKYYPKSQFSGVRDEFISAQVLPPTNVELPFSGAKNNA
ncbi:hypothetical protein K435DRAFT_803328 [Dendrothele bispora CBS 962.96]|uniref:Uncharacterized protein n=1 Tax=Dendrothele bispora (strain CBS 962.96) TaxID=1314807 RepID=A0A4S8LHU1_DENBC|nr:hypothetical protein K435DRAFT_803328 [Dendrothele bispora CBS 962.96]